MRNKKLAKWLLILFSLLAIQLITYNFFAPQQLRKELLKPYFADIIDQCDTLWIKDFHGNTCLQNFDYMHSHHLVNHRNEIQKKFEEPLILMFIPDTFDLLFEDKMPNCSYITYYQKFDPINPENWFICKQTEYFKTEKVTYSREVTYFWFLFLWVKRFEFFTWEEHC